MITEIKDFCEAMKKGGIAEIDEEMFFYFLEVLPPIAMHTAIQMPDGRMQATSFLFAEGAEEMTAFWIKRDDQKVKHYFAQKTNKMNPNA